MTGIDRSLAIAALLLGVCAAPRARAATAPSDPCSLLAASDVNAATSGHYGAPTSTVAPLPFANTVQGTDCHYADGPDELLFRIYFDPSPADATSLFARLQQFFGSGTPVPGLGDQAYVDGQKGLHVRKGNVRYFLTGHPSPAQQQAIAAVIAGKL